MSRPELPPRDRERTTADPCDVAETVADADALVYCPACETSHPATRADGWETDCEDAPV